MFFLHEMKIYLHRRDNFFYKLQHFIFMQFLSTMAYFQKNDQNLHSYRKLNFINFHLFLTLKTEKGEPLNSSRN